MPILRSIPRPRTPANPTGIPNHHPLRHRRFSLVGSALGAALLALTPGCQTPPSPPNPPPVTARSTSQLAPQLSSSRPTPATPSTSTSIPSPTLTPAPARPIENTFLPIPTPTSPTTTPNIPLPQDTQTAQPTPPASPIPSPSGAIPPTVARAVAPPQSPSPTLSQIPPAPAPSAPAFTPAAPPPVARVTADPRPSRPARTPPNDNPPPPDSPEAALVFLRRALQEQRPEALSHLGRFTLDYCDQPHLLVQAIDVARNQELALLMNLLDRGQQDSRPIEPAFRTLAETLGARRRESEILQLINEVANRECCLRRSYLAATLEGLTVGLDRASSPPIVSAEAVQRLREFTAHSDLDLAVAAAAASQFFLAPDPNGQP